MMRTLAISAFGFALAASIGCTSSEEEDLVFEEGGGKEDGVTRPYGTFQRTLADGDAGFTSLTLSGDRTYDASQELVRCDPSECTDAFSGTFRFASSNGNRYIVLYEDGDWAYSFEYKLDGNALELRATGTDSWFTMRRPGAGILINGSLCFESACWGGTHDVPEWDDVVLTLAASPSTGFAWEVTATDRAFGYPTSKFFPDFTTVGSPGTMSFRWKTSPEPVSKVGTHAVTLAYGRSGGTVEKTFKFTVVVHPAE